MKQELLEKLLTISKAEADLLTDMQVDTLYAIGEKRREEQQQKEDEIKAREAAERQLENQQPQIQAPSPRKSLSVKIEKHAIYPQKSAVGTKTNNITEELVRSNEKIFFNGKPCTKEEIKGYKDTDPFLEKALVEKYGFNDKNKEFLHAYDAVMWGAAMPYIEDALSQEIIDESQREGERTELFLSPERISINFKEIDGIVYSIGEAENIRFTHGRVLPGKTIVVYQYDSDTKKFNWVGIAATNSLLNSLINGEKRSQKVEQDDINNAVQEEKVRLKSLLISLNTNGDENKAEIVLTITEMMKSFPDEVDIGLLIKVSSDTLNNTDSDQESFYKNALDSLEQENTLQLTFIQPILSILKLKVKAPILFGKAKLATINYARNPTKNNEEALSSIAKSIKNINADELEYLKYLISANASKNTSSASAEKGKHNIFRLVTSGQDNKKDIGDKINKIINKYPGVNTDYLNQLAEKTLNRKSEGAQADAFYYKNTSEALDREEMLQAIFINPILNYINSIRELHSEDVNVDLLDRVEKEIKSFSGNPGKTIGPNFWQLAAELEAEYSVFTWGKGLAFLMVIAVISLSVLTVLSVGGFLPFELVLLGAMYQAAAGGAAAVGVSVAATAVAGAGAVSTYKDNRFLRPLYENMKQATIPEKIQTPPSSPIPGSNHKK